MAETNNKTEGRITFGGIGKPGILAKAFDQEYLVGVPIHSTYLGSDTTDADGDYSVSYSPNQYGGNPIDEDRYRQRKGYWNYKRILGIRVPYKYVPAVYKPRYPDIFIEVWQGSSKLWTSNPRKNVASKTLTISKDLPAEPEPERGLLEQIGDGIVDGFCAGLEWTAGVIEDGSETAGEWADNTFGKGSGGWIRNGGKFVADGLRGLAAGIREGWSELTGRSYPMPNELWETCIERYKNYKSDILLRHFLPPDGNDVRFQHERLIPFLVSHINHIGRLNHSRAPHRSGEKRYGTCNKNARDLLWPDSFGECELYNLNFLPVTVNSLEEGANHLLNHGEYYCRDYENGLAFTGGLISCLAREYAMTNSADYQQECESIMSLSIDTIENLESLAGLSGYIIRYDERGDSVTYYNDGVKVGNIDDSFAESLDRACGPGASAKPELLEALRALGLPLAGEYKIWRQYINETASSEFKKRHGWLVLDSDQMYRIDTEVEGDENNHQRTHSVYRAKLLSAGFSPDGPYCFQIPPGLDHYTGKKAKLGLSARLRSFEPSQDEYVHLLEGLTTASTLLSCDSEVRRRILGLLARMHRYLYEHFYYMMRPCGNFVYRGAFSSEYEYPWASLFQKILGVPSPRRSLVSTAEVLRKAGIDILDGNESDEEKERKIRESLLQVHKGDMDWFIIFAERLRTLPREVAFNCLYLIARLAGGATVQSIKDALRLLSKNGIGLEEVIENLLSDLSDENAQLDQTFSAMQIWKIHMIAKLSLGGILCGPSTLQGLTEPFLNWFEAAKRRNLKYSGQSVRNKDPELNYGLNPSTLAVAVALGRERTIGLWKSVCSFLNRAGDGTRRCCNSDEQIDSPQMSRIWSSTDREASRKMMFPKDGLRIRSWSSAARNVKECPPEDLVGCEEAGGHSLLECMWPTAVLGYSCGKPLAADISKLRESAVISERLAQALSDRQQRTNSLPDVARPVFVVCPEVKQANKQPVNLLHTLLLQRLVEDRGEERVKIIVPTGSSLHESAVELGHRIRVTMENLRQNHQLADLSFDLVCHSLGGIVARFLMLHLPSKLGMYWPNNLVMLGTPNHGISVAATLSAELETDAVGHSIVRWIEQGEALETLNMRKHHHDTRISTCCGRIQNTGGDGVVSTLSSALRPEEAIAIASQLVLANVAHTPSIAQLLCLSENRWYLENEACTASILEWIAPTPSSVRYPYHIEEDRHHPGSRDIPAKRG